MLCFFPQPQHPVHPFGLFPFLPMDSMAEFEHGQVQFKRGVATLLRQHIRMATFFVVNKAWGTSVPHFLGMMWIVGLSNRDYLTFNVNV